MSKNKQLLKVDVHVHSSFSRCSGNSLEILKKVLLNENLLIALTDHNRLTLLPNTIPGEEIKTLQGEVVALYIQEQIPPWKSLEETVDLIRSQGGISVLAHPLDYTRPNSARVLKGVIELVDYVEINGRCLNFLQDKAFLLSKNFKKRFVLGSDSHFSWELGKHYMIFRGVDKTELINNPKLFRKEVERVNLRKDFVLNRNETMKLFSQICSGFLSRARLIKSLLG
ncbi:MAG: PHP domain-containing protein [Candidatus Woesearchaeota archaeon]